MQALLQMVEAQPNSPLPWTRIKVEPAWDGYALAQSSVTVVYAEPGSAHILLCVPTDVVAPEGTQGDVVHRCTLQGVWGAVRPRVRFANRTAADERALAALPELEQTWAFRVAHDRETGAISLTVRCSLPP